MKNHSHGTPETFGMRFYRAFFRIGFKGFGRWIFGRERWEETRRIPTTFGKLPEKNETEKRVWFHAASVGELESLWPLIERAAQQANLRLILTVFSSSAWSHLHKMARKLDGDPSLYVGYSPLEGGWNPALTQAEPDLFVTAKYEAWPEIWASLGSAGVPLAIIGAKPRSSLIWAKRILGFLGGQIPEIIFFSFDPENEPGLRQRFPDAKIQHGSDPRWDRVFQRSSRPHPRVTELAEEFRRLPRPWGALGSAWPSDVNAFSVQAAASVSGTLWVVPHRTDARSVSEIEILLRERGFTPLRTATPDRIQPAGKVAVLVDEMGFLAELYSQMDWAFIGGGFGSSIHSTIEPAVYGLPIYGGPRGQMKFDEIAILKRQSQLRLYGDRELESAPSAAEDFLAWFHAEVDGKPERRIERQDGWKKENLRHRGASQRIWDELVRVLQARDPSVSPSPSFTRP